jgi:hypothetical protein
MKNLFGFLFRKHEDSIVEPKVELEIIQETELPLTEQSNPSYNTNPRVIKDKNESLSYDIDNVRKEVDKIEKEEGSQAIISYLKDFFETKHLKFNHLISFFKVLVRNMKKAKVYTPDEIFTYVNNQIENYTEKDNVVFYCEIADILERINKNYGISYLEKKVNPPETDASKDITYLLPMITLSSWYKDNEKASELKNRAFSLFSRKANDLDFKNLTLSLTTLINFLRGQGEYSDQEKINFINLNLKYFTGNNDFKIIKKIADLYGLVGITYRIEYLKMMNGKTDDNYSLLLELSDSYLQNKDFENAFKELRRATLFVNRATEQFEYLWKLKTIYEKSAEICIREKSPHYEEYLIYSLDAWGLEIVRDLVSFPHLSGFNYRKQNQYSVYTYNAYDNFEIDPDEDDDMNVALKKLNLFKNRKALFEEYNKFIYNELPRTYGIPQKYDDDSTSKLISNMSANYDEYQNLLIFSNELKSKDISYVNVEIHDFVAKLIKKYYDIDN